MRRKLYHSDREFTDADFVDYTPHRPRARTQIVLLVGLGLVMVLLWLASLVPQPTPAERQAQQQAEVQAKIHAATALCGAQLDMLSSRPARESDIILLDACVRAYLVREGIHLPR